MSKIKRKDSQRRVVSMAFTDVEEFHNQLSLVENEMGMPLARGLQGGPPSARGIPTGGLGPVPDVTPPSARGLPRGGAPPGMSRKPPGALPAGSPSGLPSGKKRQGAKKKRHLQEEDKFFSGSGPAALGSKSMYDASTSGGVEGGSYSMYEGLGDGSIKKKQSPRPSLLMTRGGPKPGMNDPNHNFLSQSTYDLSSFKSDMNDMGVEKLSNWRVRPSPSVGLGGSVSEEESKNVSQLLEKGVADLNQTPLQPIEVRDHPMEWCKMTGKEDDFMFHFMGEHGLKFKDCSILNKALESAKVPVLPIGERIDASSISLQADKNTGQPLIRSGKVNTLFLILTDAYSRKASPFSSLEMTFFLSFPLFADYDTVLSMFCSVLQQHQGGAEKELRAIIDAIHHWGSLTPEDFVDPPAGKRSYGGGAHVLTKANVILSTICSSPPMKPVPFTERNAKFVKEFRKFQPAPTPILPGNLKKGMDSLSLLTIDPVEVARQLTIHSFGIFELINPREWLTPGSSGTGIGVMSEEFNKVSNFLSESILESSDVDVRAEVIAKCVSLADELLTIKNFHSFMAVMCSLNSAPILRLQKTWKAFRKGFKEVHARYNELSEIGEMEGNFLQLRKLSTRKSDSPMIPYLGLSLSDITFILDGNKHSPVPLDHVNVEMLSMIGKVIIQIRTSQLIPYNFNPVPFVMEYLFDRRNSDQNKLYNKSLIHEPRHSKEETIKPKGGVGSHSFRRLSGFFNQSDLDKNFKDMEEKEEKQKKKKAVTDDIKKLGTPSSEPIIPTYTPDSTPRKKVGSKGQPTSISGSSSEPLSTPPPVRGRAPSSLREEDLPQGNKGDESKPLARGRAPTKGSGEKDETKPLARGRAPTRGELPKGKAPPSASS